MSPDATAGLSRVSVKQNDMATPLPSLDPSSKRGHISGGVWPKAPPPRGSLTFARRVESAVRPLTEQQQQQLVPFAASWSSSTSWSLSREPVGDNMA